MKSSLPVKEDGSYDFDKATPVVIGENGATTITSDEKGHAVSIAIPYGTYVVVESKTPHNMKTIKPFEVKSARTILTSLRHGEYSLTGSLQLSFV